MGDGVGGDGSHLGDIQFGSRTGDYFRQNIQFPFFEHYLKGKGTAQPKAVVFETGTNVWRHFDEAATEGRNRRCSTSMQEGS